MIAGKAFDIVTGVDIHIVGIPSPAGPVPTPLPHPFIGMVYDPMEFIPFIGATVMVNGMPRAQAGSEGKNVPPHIPMGGPFMKPPIGNECEVFMGSLSVNVEGEPFARLGMPVLSCQCVGMPSPPRKKKNAGPGMKLPVSVLLAIPAGMPVLVGGPPMISFTAMAMKAGMGLLSKIKGSKMMKKISDKMHDLAEKAMHKMGIPPGIRNAVHRAICTVTGHPVDVASGKVFTDRVDFEMPGPLPLVWERTWYSTSNYKGPIGHGWHHSYDMGLYVDDLEGFVVLRMPDGRGIVFPSLKEGESHFNRNDKYELLRDKKGYYIKDKSLNAYRFEGKSDLDPKLSLLTSIQNKAGYGNTFQYNSSGHLNGMQDSAGRKYKVLTDSEGKILEIAVEDNSRIDKWLKLIRYSYDADGNMTAATDALNQSQKFYYKDHLLVKETDRNGLSFYFEYDGFNSDARCIHTWGDGGIYDHKITYLEGLTIVENSLGHRTSYFHKGGLVYKTINALGGESFSEYNSFNDLIAETDEEGNTVSYTYDERSNQTGILTADGGQTSIQFNGDVPVFAMDASKGTWIWTYNEQNLLIQQLNPEGTVTRYEYENGLLSTITDYKGNKTRLQYDQQHNVSELVLSDGTRSTWEFDELGRNKEFIDGLGNRTVRKFDARGRVTGINEPDGNIRSLEYDGEENVLLAKDKLHEVKFAYTGMNRLALREENKTKVEFKYDTEDQLTGILNEKNHVYSFRLDPLGNILEEKGFDGLTRNYRRDRAGKTKTVVRPGGKLTEYEYDEGGRVSVIRQEDGSAEYYKYTANGLLLEAANAESLVKFERDNLGRVTREIQGEVEIKSVYNPQGNRISVSSNLGANIQFERTALGDISGIQAGTKETEWKAKIQYNSLGQEIERQLPGGLRSTWQRDKLGRPIQHQVSKGKTLNRSRQYEWDLEDRLKQFKDLVQGTVQFGHDVFGNLTFAQYNNGYTDYRIADEVGNIYKSKDKSDRKFGPAGQLLESNEAKYEYDAEGNLIRKTERDGKVWTYEWNANGMLKSVIRPDKNSVRFTYDALGRRLSKTYLDTCTRWVWDGNTPIHEWTEDSTQTTSALTVTSSGELELKAENKNLITWVFQDGTFSPVAKLFRGQNYSIVNDHLGTPAEMYNEKGDKVWEIGLNIYGEVRTIEGLRIECPFRFPGQYEDDETGLYYNRFRYYDCLAGIYIGQDPIGLDSRVYNLYSYVKDSNLTFDLFGLDWNYHLTDSNGNVYYHGRASDNETMSDVARRHGNNVGTDGARFGPGDTMNRVTPVGTPYDTVRGIEQRGISENQLLGRGSTEVRGNRINGISETKQRTVIGRNRLGQADNLRNGRRVSEMPSLEELKHKGC